MCERESWGDKQKKSVNVTAVREDDLKEKVALTMFFKQETYREETRKHHKLDFCKQKQTKHIL